MNELISTWPIVIQFSEPMPKSMHFRRKGKKKSKWNGMFLPLTALLIWVTEFNTSLDPHPAMDSLAKSPAHLGGHSKSFLCLLLRTSESTSLSEMHQPFYASWKRDIVLNFKFQESQSFISLSTIRSTPEQTHRSLQ